MKKMGFHISYQHILASCRACASAGCVIVKSFILQRSFRWVWRLIRGGKINPGAALLNNILPLNSRKKLALHCDNDYFCSQFEVELHGNLRMTSVLGWCFANAGKKPEVA